MEYGNDHHHCRDLHEQDAVRKPPEQLPTDLPMCDDSGARLTCQLGQDRFEAPEEFAPQPTPSLLIPVDGLLHIFFRLWAKDHSPGHERYRNLALTSSQETPASGSLTMFWSRRSNSRRCASVNDKAWLSAGMLSQISSTRSSRSATLRWWSASRSIMPAMMPTLIHPQATTWPDALERVGFLRIPAAVGAWGSLATPARTEERAQTAEDEQLMEAETVSQR